MKNVKVQKEGEEVDDDFELCLGHEAEFTNAVKPLMAAMRNQTRICGPKKTNSASKSNMSSAGLMVEFLEDADDASCAE